MPDLTISAAGLRVMKLLVGNPPQTVSDLVQAAGVTRTAVTEQLNELVATGFIERDTERLPGRGRPRYRYKATDAAMVLLFPANQCLVVPAIWNAIYEIGGESLGSKVLKRVGRAMADYYKRKVTAKDPRERLRQLIELFVAEGGLVDMVENDEGQLMIYKRSCPFISMVDGQRSVCHIDREMMSEVVGQPVRRTSCRHDGAPCCIFELVDD